MYGLLGFLGLLLSLPSAADEQCKACDSSGLVACKTCAKDPCSENVVVLHCSVRISCKTCEGAGSVDCR